MHGEGRRFSSAIEAVKTLRDEAPGLIDQYLPPFVIADADGPVGRVADGDAVIFFNFRGDRAIEIARAFDTPPASIALTVADTGSSAACSTSPLFVQRRSDAKIGSPM